jgi:hypothetical protein
MSFFVVISLLESESLDHLIILNLVVAILVKHLLHNRPGIVVTTDVVLHEMLQLCNCEVVLVLLDGVGTLDGIVAYESETNAEDRFAEEDLLANGGHHKFFLAYNTITISVERININRYVMGMTISQIYSFICNQTVKDLPEFKLDLVKLEDAIALGPVIIIVGRMIQQVFVAVADLGLEQIENGALQRPQLSVSDDI